MAPTTTSVANFLIIAGVNAFAPYSSLAARVKKALASRATAGFVIISLAIFSVAAR